MKLKKPWRIYQRTIVIGVLMAVTIMATWIWNESYSQWTVTLLAIGLVISVNDADAWRDRYRQRAIRQHPAGSQVIHVIRNGQRS